MIALAQAKHPAVRFAVGDDDADLPTDLDAVLAIGEVLSYVTDRPGHDRRYAMDIARISERLGWRPQHTFEQGLRETVEWYVANERWWRRVQSEAYRASQALYLTGAAR